MSPKLVKYIECEAIQPINSNAPESAVVINVFHLRPVINRVQGLSKDLFH